VDAKNTARLSTTFKFLSPLLVVLRVYDLSKEAKYEDYIHLDGIIASYDELDRNS